MPAFSPQRLPFLIDVCAQCIVSDEESRIAVLTPAIATGSSCPRPDHWSPCHDPDEEVGREEGPEDHDLRDDEKQHPEQLGLDARAAVGRRRAVVVRRRGRSWRLPWRTSVLAQAAVGLLGHDVLDRACRRLAHALDEVGAHPARARRGQRRDDDVVDAGRTAARSSSRCRDRGRRSCPRRAGPRGAGGRAPGPAGRAPGGVWMPSPPSWGTTTMNRWRSVLGAMSLIALAAAARPTPCALATTSVTSKGRPSASMSATTCSTGSAGGLADALDEVAPQPARRRRREASR